MTCQRSSHRMCSVEKVFLEISQNSQENTCARVSFLIKLPGLRPFPINFVKFLRTFFLQNTSGRLLLVLRMLFLQKAPSEINQLKQ